jgi:hypothetical protein
VVLFWNRAGISCRRATTNVTLFALVAGLVVLPWTARNYAIHRRVVFVTTDTGELFWRGNNPIASGGASLPDGRPVFEGASVEFRERIRSADELGRRALFWAAASQFVQEDPLAFLALLGKKWVTFWWWSEGTGRE